MYLYNTTSDETLPIYGWLFPCSKCYRVTSNLTEIILFYDHKYRDVSIPLCKSCNINNIKFDKYKIKYIE